MDDNDSTHDGDSNRLGDLEQRIDALEERNEELETENEQIKTQLDQQGSSRLPNVTRRQALGGLLGGGALLGAAGSASAQPPSGPGGPPFADEDHDHSGDYLGESESVDRIDVTDLNAESLSSGNGDTSFADEDHDHSGDYLGQGEPVDRIDVNDAHVGEIYNMHGSDEVIQTAWDGMVVPVAKGLGSSDAIDPNKTETPIQDAIDAVNAAADAFGGPASGSGAVLLPPGITDSPGNLRGLGAIQLLGWGIHASTIQITDNAADGIRVTGHNDGTGAWLDGFAIRHRTPGQQTGGSAIHFTDFGGVWRFDIGNLQFTDWKGPAPVIHYDGGGAFSSSWGYLNGPRGIGTPFLKVNDIHFRDVAIRELFLGPDSNDWVIDIQSPFTVAARIDIINMGGQSAHALRYDANDNQHTALHVGALAAEPNSVQTASGAIVECRGSAKAIIEQIGASGGLLLDHAVKLTDSPLHGTGPGKNRIGRVFDKDGTNYRGKLVKLSAPADFPSWYWGPSNEVDYGGHGVRSVIPLAETGDYPPADLSGVTGNYDGEQRPDSGVNSAGRGVLCVWDSKANSGSGGWRKPNGTLI